MKLHQSEQQLEADDRPLQHLAQLGPLASQVQFTLRRSGPSLDPGPNTHARSSWAGASSPARRTEPNGCWSPSPRASPEPRASPLCFLNPTSSKEEVFREALQQQQRLQRLQLLLGAVERETALWEAETNPRRLEELEELEEQLRQEQAELLLGERWEEELRAEAGRERGTRATFAPSSSDACEHMFSV